MFINAPVYSHEGGVHFVNIYEERDDGTFRRTQDEPLRLLRDNIKGISRAQGELVTGVYDRVEHTWNTPTVNFQYGHPQSFYQFLRDMVAKNKFYVFSKPQLSGRLSKFDLHILDLKSGTSQRHLSLLKEKYVESLHLWSKGEHEVEQLKAKQKNNQTQEVLAPGGGELDVDFVDARKTGLPGNVGAAVRERQTDKFTADIQRVGDVAGVPADGRAKMQFPNKKSDQKSHFLQRFIFTID